jgi:oxaloacetate decarboxylase alpha subunit
VGDLAKSEEDVLMYALFPNEARTYLTAHQEGAESAVFLMSEEYSTCKGDAPVDVEQIRELIKIVEGSDVSEVTVEENGAKIVVRKGGVLVADAPATAAPAPGPGVPAPTPAAAPDDAAARPVAWKQVVSPMVGTFYRSSSPGVPAFVEVDAVVAEGATLCIVEAMKLMNEIAAEEAGVIREVAVEDGAPVEYGTVLFWYEPA